MSRKFIVLMACALTLAVPSCSRVVSGHAMKPASEKMWTPEPTKVPYTPTNTYTALTGEVMTAAASIGAFWRTRTNTPDVMINMPKSALDVPCLPEQPVEIVNTWVCDGPIPKMVVYLPTVQENIDKYGNGKGLIWMFVGYDYGQILIHTQNIPVANVDALAFCLAGASVEGNGMGTAVLSAAESVYPVGGQQYTALKFGIQNGFQACIDNAR